MISSKKSAKQAELDAQYNTAKAAITKEVRACAGAGAGAAAQGVAHAARQHAHPQLVPFCLLPLGLLPS